MTQKLWMLTPRRLGAVKDHWEPWYDKCFGFVVRAETEQEARMLAEAAAGDESRNEKVWLNAEYSFCDLLVARGMPGVIINDVARA